jgi:hypothetical protein
MHFDATLFTTVYQVIGLPAALMLIYWIAMKWMHDQGTKINADRIEHIRKWDSMVQSYEKQNKLQIQSHQDEIERMFKLHERQTCVSEMNAAELIKITEGVRQIHDCIQKLSPKVIGTSPAPNNQHG